jgi:hypothetical protein
MAILWKPTGFSNIEQHDLKPRDIQVAIATKSESSKIGMNI